MFRVIRSRILWQSFLDEGPLVSEEEVLELVLLMLRGGLDGFTRYDYSSVQTKSIFEVYPRLDLPGDHTDEIWI
jgi:hypothetical protein